MRAATSGTRLRIAGALLAVQAVPHTVSAVNVPPATSEPGAVFATMRAFHFTIMGAERTYYDFYLGYGLLLTVYLVFGAALAWWAGGLCRRHPAEARPLAWLLFVGNGFVATLAWTNFFLAPAVVSTAVAALMGAAAIGLSGSGAAASRPSPIAS